jgi:two-component system, LytTR family, response regulator
MGVSDIRCVIADDEPLARDGIRLALEREPGLTIVGEAQDGLEAAALVARLRPDLLMLDVQMPGLDGFGVLDALAGSHLPAVIFVTAYDDYALRAFDVHALDYLLKPISPNRLADALRVARGALASQTARDLRRRLLDLVSTRRLEPSYQKRFIVRDGERYVVVPADEVDSFEADGNYIQLHTRTTTYMMRKTMVELEAELNPARFVRIHRSAIVNVDRIAEVTSEQHGDFTVCLAEGRRLRLGRAYRDRLLP